MPDAKAFIKGGDQNRNILGTADFYQKCFGVLAVVSLSGLPENESGFFALHIHQGESCEGENFSKTAGHYNKDDASHPNHAGDLPPLINCSGKAYLTVLTDRFKVNDIIGKTVVIHSDADDFHSQPAGNAGPKIACGEIIKA